VPAFFARHLAEIIYDSRIMRIKTDPQPPSKVRMREHLGADALFKAMRNVFARIQDPRAEKNDISLADVLMSAFAMFSLKDPSLLAFDKRKTAEEHNIKAIYGIKDIPCDTQMRTRLDPVDIEAIRPAYKEVFRRLQRGKVLEELTVLDGYYVISLDGTGYFSSDKLYSPACLEKHSSKTGKSSYYLQMLGAAIVKPGCREVIPLSPEFICKHDGQTKNDCERNACRRWLEKFRKDHPHLKVIITEDGLSSNAPHIRDLQQHNCRFVLGAKDGDHVYLFKRMKEAKAAGLAREHEIPIDSNPQCCHRFHFYNGIPLNASNQDLLVNVLEYWEERGDKALHFCWITDFELTEGNVYEIMRIGRSRWKIENETFNTLKNQGYNLEHNYGLGEQNLSMIFVLLMMLAFLVDQAQQLSCAMFQAVWKRAGCKRELWDSIKSVFRLLKVYSMEELYRVLLYGAREHNLVLAEDSS